MSKDQCVELAVKTLLEVVESGAKNMEIAVLTADKPMEMLSNETLDTIVKKIEKEKAEKEEEKTKDK